MLLCVGLDLRAPSALCFFLLLISQQPHVVLGTDNLINGTYSCENKHTLTDHLKGNLNFSGWVVSDWCVSNHRQTCFFRAEFLHIVIRGGRHCRSDSDVQSYLSRVGVQIMDRLAHLTLAWIRQ